VPANWKKNYVSGKKEQKDLTTWNDPLWVTASAATKEGQGKLICTVKAVGGLVARAEGEVALGVEKHNLLATYHFCGKRKGRR